MIFVVDVFHFTPKLAVYQTEIGVKVCLLNSNSLKCIKIEFSVFLVAISQSSNSEFVKCQQILIILQINRRSIFSSELGSITSITRPMQWLISTLIPSQ